MEWKGDLRGLGLGRLLVVLVGLFFLGCFGFVYWVYKVDICVFFVCVKCDFV